MATRARQEGRKLAAVAPRLSLAREVLLEQGKL